MAESVLKDVRVYVDGYNISGKTNSLTLEKNADIKDRTTFDSSSRKRKAGLIDTSISMSGFWNSTDSGGIDNIAEDGLGSTGVLSIVPDGTGVNSLAYFMENINAEYQQSGNIGDLYGFTMAANGQGNPARGKTLICGWAATDPAASTVINLGPATTNKNVCFAVHVLDTSSTGTGGNIKLEIACSTDSGFTGSPSTLFTISLTTAHVNKGVFVTTALNTTSLAYYRGKVLQAGTSDKKFKIMTVIGRD